MTLKISRPQKEWPTIVGHLSYQGRSTDCSLLLPVQLKVWSAVHAEMLSCEEWLSQLP